MATFLSDPSDEGPGAPVVLETLLLVLGCREPGPFPGVTERGDDNTYTSFK